MLNVGGVVEAVGRVSPRRATYFLLLRQKKVGKEKATPLSVSLRFAPGNLPCSATAGVRRTRSAALRSDSCGPDPAYTCAPRHSQRGVVRAIASLGPSAPYGPSLRSARGIGSLSLWERAGVRASGGGYGQIDGQARCPHPNPLPERERGQEQKAKRSKGRRNPRPSEAMARAACGAERSDGPSDPLWLRRGAQLLADQGSQLSEQSEFCETPPKASTAGCPVAQRRGRRQRGRLFFGYFLLAKQKKVTRLPGRDPAHSLRRKSPSNKRPLGSAISKSPCP